MAIITFDCDEVLADLVKAMLERHDNTFFGVPLAWDDIVDYYIEYLPQFQDNKVSFAEAKHLFDETILDHGRVQPVAGMPALVADLKRQWHELYVITARGDELTTATINWIDQHYHGMFNDIILANHYNENKQCKGDLCHYVWSQLMVEDTIHNTEKVIAKNIPVIMPEKPWNKKYIATSDLIHKASDAEQIGQILVEKGFL